MRRLAKYWFLFVAILAAAQLTDGLVHAEAPEPAPLSPQEQAAIDQFLAAWEARSAAVRTWSCKFYKWEYDNVWGSVGPNGRRLAVKECTGTLKYGAPDKGLFRVVETKQWNVQKNQYEVLDTEAGEHWVWNGESIYQFDHPNRRLKETRLPPESRAKTDTEHPWSSFCGGKTIADWFARIVSPGGPIGHLMPLVLGDRAASLTKRYRIRIVTPPESREHVWLEAIPRDRVDAACLSRLDIMLDAHDLKPFAIRVHFPGGQRCDVYQVEQKSSTFNGDCDVLCNFAKPPTPLGYTYEFFDLQALTDARNEVPKCERLPGCEKSRCGARKALFCTGKRPRLMAATLLKSRAVSRRSSCCAQSRQTFGSDGGHLRRHAWCR